MIKLLVVVFCVGAVIQAVHSKHTMYGNSDVDDILDHEDMVNAHFKCLMDKGGCIAEDESFKKLLPEVLNNKCAKCSANEKEASDKIMKFLKERRNDMWKQIVAKYGS